jgi:hypothetical protein
MSPFPPPAALRSEGLTAWPYLGPERLLQCRSSRVCLTCHWFRHHADGEGIPLLSCHWHQGLICHGDHLTHRCSCWLEARHAGLGWCPEAA